MAEDLVSMLTGFHRERLLPDVRRVVTGVVEASEHRLRDELRAEFDSAARELTNLRREQVRILQGRPEQ